MASSTMPADADKIRREMAQIRRELHLDVRDVVISAEAAADWRRYIRRFPWVICGAAFAAGYLLVPSRRRVVPVQYSDAVPESFAAPRRAGLVSKLYGLLGPVAIRAGQNYASYLLEQWMSQQGSWPGASAGVPSDTSRSRPSGPRSAGSADRGFDRGDRPR